MLYRMESAVEEREPAAGGIQTSQFARSRIAEISPARGNTRWAESASEKIFKPFHFPMLLLQRSALLSWHCHPSAGFPCLGCQSTAAAFSCLFIFPVVPANLSDATYSAPHFGVSLIVSEKNRVCGSLCIFLSSSLSLKDRRLFCCVFLIRFYIYDKQSFFRPSPLDCGLSLQFSVWAANNLSDRV